MTDFKRALENRAGSSYIAEYSAPKIELADLYKFHGTTRMNSFGFFEKVDIDKIDNV